jgi:methyl-accepting chemotaxis protein
MKLKLRHKIQLVIISLAAIIFLGAIGYLSYKAKNEAYNNSLKLIQAQAENYSNKIEGIIAEDFAVVRTLGNAFKTYEFLPKDEWQQLIRKMYVEVFKANPSFYQIWDSWELQYIDSTYNKPYGRLSNTVIQRNGSINSTWEYRSMDGDQGLYKKNKARNTDFITNIYTDVFGANKDEKKLMATLWESITINGNYIGVVGLDITLDQFQEIVKDIKIGDLEGSHAFLLTHNAKYAGHPNKELLNTQAPENPTKQKDFNLYQKIKGGEKFSLTNNLEQDDEKYVIYSPIKIGKTDMHWYLGISVPEASIMDKANRNFRISLIVGLLGLLILGSVIYIVARNITIPIEKVTTQLNKLSRGSIEDDMKLSLQTGDEIEEMAKALNTSIDELNKKNKFAQMLGEGDLEHDFELSTEEDQLGHSLIEMRDSLKKAREEEEKRKIEDEKRRWVNEGLAKFGDILRQNNDDLSELAYSIIKNLVEYLEANQGGLFILNDEDENDVVYELKAAYAYNRKKYLQKQIRPGEGLLGNCALEKKTIYMTDIPENYINITSGLGDANPRSLLIVPLKTEEEVLGVVEIASFNEIEKHQIEFVEKVAESIASTISSVRTNLKTSELLEKSQQQAEEMSAQEEEMRQNMEELQATQEESARREQEFTNVIEAIDKFLLKAEMDTRGTFISANKLFKDTTGYSDDEIKNMAIFDLIHQDEKETFDTTWQEVHKGFDKQKVLKCQAKNGDTLWLITSFSPMKDRDENITKILYMSLDHSDSEKEKINLRNQLNQ